MQTTTAEALFLPLPIKLHFIGIPILFKFRCCVLHQD